MCSSQTALFEQMFRVCKTLCALLMLQGVLCVHNDAVHGYILSEEMIENVIEVVPGVYSGSEPRTEADFASLERLGIGIVVSVDGAHPNVAMAERFGLRYVHLPIGYDGIGEERQRELASVMKKSVRGVYVHCYHGVHRGPAAAAVGLVGAGVIDNETGIALLIRAGTSVLYDGLFASVRRCVLIEPEDFVELSTLPTIANVEGSQELMAQIGRVWERVEIVRDADWQESMMHPDLVPAAEVSMLADGLRQMREDSSVRGYPEDFHEQLFNIWEQSVRLEETVVARDRVAADILMARIEANCRSCHAAYRD